MKLLYVDLLRNCPADSLAIQFSEDLSEVLPEVKGANALRGFVAAVEDLHGVEKVFIQRYSLRVKIAGHITTSKEVAHSIVDILRDHDTFGSHLDTSVYALVHVGINCIEDCSEERD